MKEQKKDVETLFADDPELLGILQKESAPLPGTAKSRSHLPSEINSNLKKLKNHQQSVSQSKIKKFGRVLFSIAFYILILVIIGGAVLFAFSNNPEKAYFNHRLYSVKTSSMSPKKDGSSPPGGFNSGDTILIKLCKPETIQVGDIVTYIPGDDPYTYLTHRVVKVLDHLNEDKGIFFVTKGDSNDAEDPPIKGDMVVGKKVLVIPGTGAVLQFIRDNFVLSLLITVSGIGAVILLRMYFFDPDKKMKSVQ
ncbi:MAG: signal peptidase I [Oscillospiraceae bacterium]|nr:signal peptidase I [Oscillospiraceae bacterium]